MPDRGPVTNAVVCTLGVLTVLALAACSGAGSATPPPLDGESAPPVEPAPTPTPSVAAHPEPGPLEAYLAFGDELDSPEAIVAWLTWRENLTAACMADLGFEYTPQVPAVDKVRYDEGPAQGSREFVEDFGYGIWSPPPGGGYSVELGADPNEARVAEMSEAGRAAYTLALSGPITAEYDDGSVRREGGCAGTADTPQGDDTAYLVGVRDEARAFLDALSADTRFIDVDADWASCMADAGFDDRSPAAALQRVRDDSNAAFTAAVAPEPAVISENAAEERRLALADLECREATDWTARHRAVELVVQQEYVDAHLADLEALVAAMAPGTDDD